MLPIVHNDFFSGGALLMGLGVVGAYLRHIPTTIFNEIKRRTVLTVEFEPDDTAIAWLKLWLAEHEYGKKTKSLTAMTKTKARGEDRVVVLTPSTGTHFFWHNGKFFVIHVGRDKLQNVNDMGKVFVNNLSVSIFGGTRKNAEDLIQEARERYKKLNDDGVLIYANRYSQWTCIAKKNPRKPESLIYQEDYVGDVINDINKFLESRDWYDNFGVPWRRGFLLYGEPGNGKTSIIESVAGILGKNIYYTSLNKDVDDEDLQDAFSRVPNGEIIVIEEIDTVFDKRKESEDTAVTFGGFLNSLDGLVAKDGQIVFMTTNHKEKLDPALIRPGRADRHFYIGNATKEQAKKMFLRFFPGEEEKAEEFISYIKDGEKNMASIQEILVGNRDNPDDCLESIKKGE